MTGIIRVYTAGGPDVGGFVTKVTDGELTSEADSAATRARTANLIYARHHHPGDSMKVLRIAIAGLALPVALAAQQPATSQANPMTATFKTRIATFHRNIAQAFDSIPESKFGYKPTPRAADLRLHRSARRERQPRLLQQLRRDEANDRRERHVDAGFGQGNPTSIVDLASSLEAGPLSHRPSNVTYRVNAPMTAR